MFVFGIDLPLPEMMVIAMLLLIIALVFIFIQMRHINHHIKVLERTTYAIRKATGDETVVKDASKKKR